MKTTTNITNTQWDLERYANRADVEAFLDKFGLDGLEVMPYGKNSLSFLPEARTIGIHLGYFPSWVDFYTGNEQGVIAEFSTLEEAYAHFGGRSPRAIEEFFSKQLDFAQSVKAEYVVFHVSDVSLEEAVSYRFRHTNREVIEASLSLINRVLDEKRHSFAFLMENQWWPGLTFLSPQEDLALLSGVKYKNKGFMLDTGHLMHMNLDLKTEEDGAALCLRALSAHPALLENVRGMHLHQSLTGDFVKQMLKNPPELRGSYRERLGSAYECILGIDLHRPFTAPCAARLVDAVQPEYLTHEFITESRAQHEAFLETQLRALGG